MLFSWKFYSKVLYALILSETSFSAWCVCLSFCFTLIIILILALEMGLLTANTEKTNDFSPVKLTSTMHYTTSINSRKTAGYIYMFNFLRLSHILRNLLIFAKLVRRICINSLFHVRIYSVLLFFYFMFALLFISNLYV